MESSFCLEAIQEALELFPKPEIFNTDQGSQFTSEAFIGALRSLDLERDVTDERAGKVCGRDAWGGSPVG
jgi:putative transposase